MASHKKHCFVILFPLSQLFERCPKAKHLNHPASVTSCRTLAITEPIISFPLLIMFIRMYARGIVTIAICVPPYAEHIALTLRVSTGTPASSASAFCTSPSGVSSSMSLMSNATCCASCTTVASVSISAATASLMFFALLSLCSSTNRTPVLLLVHSVLHQLEDAGVSRILVLTLDQYCVWFRSRSYRTLLLLLALFPPVFQFANLTVTFRVGASSWRQRWKQYCPLILGVYGRSFVRSPPLDCFVG